VRLGLLALLIFPAARLLAAAGPILADFTTCSQLTSNFYPADTTTWFDASKNPQIVLFAHMLFPLRPGQDDLIPAPTPEAWHPPLIVKAPPAATLRIDDVHFVEAQWLDPEGALVADFGLTMPARVSTDYIRLQARQYIPHTFSMTIGTKDIRTEAGQKALPSRAGQYHARLYVDGQIEGIAFFRMMGSALIPEATPAPQALTETPEEGSLNALRDVFRALTKTGN